MADFQQFPRWITGLEIGAIEDRPCGEEVQMGVDPEAIGAEALQGMVDRRLDRLAGPVFKLPGKVVADPIRHPLAALGCPRAGDRIEIRIIQAHGGDGFSGQFFRDG